MSKAAPTPLMMPAIARKGDASPAVTSLEAQHHEPAATPTQTLAPAPPPIQAPETPPAPRLLSRVQATIAVTVRLDETRYERMKSWGTGRRVTNQEIIVAALDRFFSLSDEEREDRIARVRR
jgi:hypothetical protein